MCLGDFGGCGGAHALWRAVGAELRTPIYSGRLAICCYRSHRGAQIGSSLSSPGGSGVGKERTASGLEAFRVISFHSVLMLW